MTGTRDWSEVSFTVRGEEPVKFGDVSIAFPSINAHISRKFVVDDLLYLLDDFLGPIDIRITSSKVSAIPRFSVGKIGTFQGKYRSGRIYTVTNAKVVSSMAADLLLQSESTDGVTTPVAEIL